MCARLLRRAALALAALLIGSPAWAGITYDSNEAANTIATNRFNDSTENLTWSSAPGASGRIVYCWALILSNAVTFSTPTVSNVSFTNDVTIQRTGLTLTLWRGNTTGAAGTTVTFGTSGNNSSNAQMACASFTPTNAITGYDTAESSSEEAVATTDHDPDVSVTSSGLGASRGGVVFLVTSLTSAASAGQPVIDADFTALTRTDTLMVSGYRILSADETTTADSTSSPGRISGTVMMLSQEDAPAAGGVCTLGLLGVGC